MAEERLIDNDEDKNRKYKIQKNADGEDELVILTGEEEEEPDETVGGYVIPEFEEDDEEAAVMTPEQLAARERARQEESERRERAVAENLAKAREYLAETDFDNAAYALSLAEEADPSNGEVAALKLKAFSRNFTDYTRLDECVAAARAVGENCDGEQRQALLAEAQPLVRIIAETRQEADVLAEENESKRAERQVVFAARRNRAVKFFLVTALPFLVFLALALAYSTVMFAKQDGTNLVLTIVFAAVALVFFLATLFTAHKLWAAQRNIRRNAKNSSTKVGRQYEQTMQKLKALCDVYAALGGKE